MAAQQAQYENGILTSNRGILLPVISKSSTAATLIHCEPTIEVRGEAYI